MAAWMRLSLVVSMLAVASSNSCADRRHRVAVIGAAVAAAGQTRNRVRCSSARAKQSNCRRTSALANNRNAAHTVALVRRT